MQVIRSELFPIVDGGSTQRKNIEKLNAAKAIAGIRCELFPIIAWRRARQKNLKNKKDISKGKV